MKKNSLINILTAVLFIAGISYVFFGSNDKRENLFNLSANASIMLPESQNKFPAEKGSKAVSSVIAEYSENISEPSETESPSLNINYTPKAPVLASDSAQKTEIKNDTDYSVDASVLLSEPVYKKSGDKTVLIMHTHTSESYADSAADSGGSYRNQNEETNIISVGNVIEQILTERGIGVIHDKTYHDYPSYSGAYKRALETINKNLAEYPTVTFVFDVHRDAMQDESGQYMKTQYIKDGIKSSQALLVVGTDANGLEHPNWRENLKYALRIQQKMNEKYPGLARPLHLRKERFNGHACPGEMIIEVGSNGNTAEESRIAAKYIADCIADVISEIPENR